MPRLCRAESFALVGRIGRSCRQFADRPQRSLDVPFRRPDAPNGVEERLSVDMIADSKNKGALRRSLEFAAFPEIFDATIRDYCSGSRIG
jgi:lysylphosphatidylglycerol synthetase-like protein (DUF2156 family)